MSSCRRPPASARRDARSVKSTSDLGSATMLVMVAALALMTGVVLAIGHVGGLLVDRARAQNAADAAALAAVIAGPDAAAEVASRHGASVVQLEVSGGVATVIVRCGKQQAVARATNRP